MISVIDCGGSSTRFGIWDGQKLSQVITLATPSYHRHKDLPIEELQKLWLTFLKKNLIEHKNCSSISIGFAGPVKNDSSISFSPNIWGPKKNRLSIETIEKFLEKPCCIINDLSAAIIRYGYDDRYQSYKRIMLLTISTGVGSKIFDITHKELLIDQHGRSGELGKIHIDNIFIPSASRSFSGTLEKYASGLGITHLAKICSKDIELHNIQASKILRLCQKGHSEASRIINIATEILAQILQTTILSAAPEKIFIMGGILQDNGNLFKQQLISSLLKLKIYEYSKSELEELFELGYGDDYSGMIGAGLYAKNKGY